MEDGGDGLPARFFRPHPVHCGHREHRHPGRAPQGQHRGDDGQQSANPSAGQGPVVLGEWTCGSGANDPVTACSTEDGRQVEGTRG